jgi:hypothetical protein
VRGDDGGGLVGFAVALVLYELVGLTLYLGAVHTEALLSLVEAESLGALAIAVPGVILARPDALAVAVGLGLFAGVTTFVQESTPGVPDLVGPGAPTGLAYPFYVLQVGVGLVLGTVLGALIGMGLYLTAIRPDALGAGAGTSDVGAVAALVLGLVVSNPDALIGVLGGGAIGFWSGYTGRIWARSDRQHHGGGDFDGGGFGGFGGFGGGGGGGGGGDGE